MEKTVRIITYAEHKSIRSKYRIAIFTLNKVMKPISNPTFRGCFGVKRPCVHTLPRSHQRRQDHVGVESDHKIKGSVIRHIDKSYLPVLTFLYKPQASSFLEALRLELRWISRISSMSTDICFAACCRAYKLLSSFILRPLLIELSYHTEICPH